MKKPTSEKQVYLQFPDNIRHSMGMYLGSNDEPSVAFREVFDNSVDCIRQYGATRVDAFIQDEFFVVTDNGPGLPLYTDTHVEGEMIPAGQALLQRIHMGNKSHGEGDVTGGLHGVGVAAVNATSSSLVAIVNLKKRLRKDGKDLHDCFNRRHEIAIIEFERGILKRCESANRSEAGMKIPDDFGTVIIVKPDPECWKSTKPVIDPMTPSLNKSSLMASGLEAELFINGKEVLPFSMKQAFPKTKTRDAFEFEFKTVIPHETLPDVEVVVRTAFAVDQWDHAGTGSANGMPAVQGPHVTSAINGVARGLADMSNVLNVTDCKASLRVFVQIIAANRLRFDGQTKARLADIEDLSSKALSSAIQESFGKSVKKDKKAREWFDTLLKFLIEYKKASGNIELTEHLKDEIQTSDQGSLRGEGSKFYEARRQKDPNSELMIAEGDSALSNVLTTRGKAHNAGLHALLPLRGKIINTGKAPPEKAFDNKEIKTLFRVMGAGVEGVNFKLKSLRYGKIIIMTDSDPDGSAIRALLIAAFARYAPKIIQAGRLYCLITPLYGQDGKYIYKEEDLDRSKKFKRFKGLGALEKSHCLDVIFGEERHLVQITDDDLHAAIELVAQPGPKKKLMREAGLIQ